MTVQSLALSRLLTIADYLELGEDEHGRTELQEGSLVMSPSPTPDHNLASRRLANALERWAPPDLEVNQDMDVDLQLAPADGPGTVRRPDVIVVRRSARERVRAEGGVTRADEIVVAVEIVSPGSGRMDNVMKRTEYADAGIPHYWIVDLEEPVSLVACELHGDFGYRDREALTDLFTAAEPFDVTIDLAGLLD